MRPVSDRFLAAVGQSHRPVCAATLYDVRTDVQRDLPLADGSVSLDNGSATRASCSLTLAPAAHEFADLVPTGPDSLLAPYGNEIKVERGIEHVTGDVEWVSVGIFRVEETSVDDTGPDLVIAVSGLDRSAIAIDAVFESGDELAAGADAAETIASLLEPHYANGLSLADDFGATTVTLPALFWETGQDRWDFCRGLAEAAGCRLYFDGDGILCMRPVPPVSETSVFRVAEGEGGVLLSASKRWSREDAVNRVVVDGENISEDPYHGTWTDDDPASPTYYQGPFGKRTYAYSSERITSDAQATFVAGVIGALRRGSGQQISFASLVNPALEPGDVVEVERERIGVSELHTLDQIEIPLTADGEMTAQTRVTRVL